MKNFWGRLKTKFLFHKRPYTIKTLIQICLIPIYAALVFALKEAMAFLPNIEPVTLLILFAGVYFPFYMSFGISLIFCFLDGLYWGFNLSWFLPYLIIWPLLAVLGRVCRPLILRWWWTFIIIAGLFGLLFGFVFAVINWLLVVIIGNQINGGQSFALIAWWLNGLSYDGIHCAGNIMMAGVLFYPLTRLWVNHLQYYLFYEDDKRIISYNIFSKKTQAKLETTSSLEMKPLEPLSENEKTQER
ncbi:hypothetical protein [Spiroplasma sp. DGKH1]|uniref:hypothetical protein n=1 Tax=Spiroplasma sp. DGKH1 TaxID=3050074 RepID=UPI0034C5DD2E